MNLGIIILLILLAILYFGIGLRLTLEYRRTERITKLSNRLLIFLLWIIVIPIWVIDTIVVQDK